MSIELEFLFTLRLALQLSVLGKTHSTGMWTSETGADEEQVS